MLDGHEEVLHAVMGVIGCNSLAIGIVFMDPNKCIY